MQMHPAALLPDISHLQKIGIESSLSDAIAESWLMHPGGTRGYYHTVKVVLANISFYFFLTRVRAGILIADRDHYPGQFLGIFSYIFAINRACYIKSALTDEDTYSWFFLCQLTYLLWQ
jgi:hypothetical protein